MIDAIKTPSIDVRVYNDRQSMGQAAAEAVAQRLHILLMQQPHVNMIFAAAPSQNEFLKALASQIDIDWNRVNAFHMDEYLGLEEDAPQNFGIFLKSRIFSKLPFRSVNYISGDRSNAEHECRRYSELLQRFPADIVCMGIGENGHIAFNDPPVADFNDTSLVKIVELDNVCRQQQVNDKCFHSLSQVPLNALTLTIPALMSGKHIYCIVPGRTKANAVFNTLRQEITERYPATILRRHPNTILFLDKDSSELL